MSIDSYKGKHTLICDICYETTQEFSSFDEAVKEKKSNGWKSKLVQKSLTGWIDICPDCQKNKGLQK